MTAVSTRRLHQVAGYSVPVRSSAGLLSLGRGSAVEDRSIAMRFAIPGEAQWDRRTGMVRLGGSEWSERE